MSHNKRTGGNSDRRGNKTAYSESRTQRNVSSNRNASLCGIRPALEEGKIVISDRFVDSSIVYQGIARKLGISTVSAVNAPGIGIYRPDGIFFIDLSEAEGLRRKKEQKNLDRMEQEGIDFHHMVSEGYRKVLSGRPEVMKIDGGRSIDTIQKKIRNHVDELLKKKNR